MFLASELFYGPVAGSSKSERRKTRPRLVRTLHDELEPWQVASPEKITLHYLASHYITRAMGNCMSNKARHDVSSASYWRGRSNKSYDVAEAGRREVKEWRE